jgi:threonine dehydrogenase-like Zn-dependent dehydrogenase
MKTRTTIFHGSSKLEVIEIELPPLKPTQVLAKVKACALCTWEQRMFKGTNPDDYPFRGGHEVSAEVVEIGPEAKCNVKPGDPISPAIMTRCGVCDNCRRGMDNFCEYDDGGRLPGLPWGPGGLSDYLILEDYQVYKAATGRDFAELALAEPIACVTRSVMRPEILFGDTVLIQGAGIMGLLHIELLKQRGVRIVVCEPDEVRRKEALAIGADLVFDPFSKQFEKDAMEATFGRGFKASFFTAGGIQAIDQVLHLMAKGAWIMLYGSVNPKGLLQLDPNQVHYNELVITGTFSHTKYSFRQSVDMLSLGMLNVSPFISERVPFPDVNKGMEHALKSNTYRVVMMFD